MSEPLVLIVNPAATRVEERLIRRVAAALGAFGPTETLRTDRSGHAAILAAELTGRGVRAVAVLGGDGTVNEVAGALAGTGTALLPLAGGSTNVFARALGWPHPARAAAGILETALAADRRRVVTLGVVATGGWERVFALNMGVGLDAETAHRVERRGWVKRGFRQAGFGLVAAGVAVRTLRRPGVLSCTVDGGPPEPLTSVVVTTGSPYAYLGGRALDLAPGADFDGRLRWMGLTSADPRLAAGVVAGALRGGSHIGRPGVRDGWAEREIRIRADRPVALQADGEPLGWHDDIVARPGPRLVVLLPA